LSTVTVNSATNRATLIAGRRNCHTDTPAARATTNSWLRVRRQKVAIPANSTVKGMTS
jgi:hypothetical protein